MHLPIYTHTAWDFGCRRLCQHPVLTDGFVSFTLLLIHSSDGWNLSHAILSPCAALRLTAHGAVQRRSTWRIARHCGASRHTVKSTSIPPPPPPSQPHGYRRRRWQRHRLSGSHRARDALQSVHFDRHSSCALRVTLHTNLSPLSTYGAQFTHVDVRTAGVI